MAALILDLSKGLYDRCTPSRPLGRASLAAGRLRNVPGPAESQPRVCLPQQPTKRQWHCHPSNGHRQPQVHCLAWGQSRGRQGPGGAPGCVSTVPTASLSFLVGQTSPAPDAPGDAGPSTLRAHRPPLLPRTPAITGAPGDSHHPDPEDLMQAQLKKAQPATWGQAKATVPPEHRVEAAARAGQTFTSTSPRKPPEHLGTPRPRPGTQGCQGRTGPSPRGRQDAHRGWHWPDQQSVHGSPQAKPALVFLHPQNWQGARPLLGLK